MNNVNLKRIFIATIVIVALILGISTINNYFDKFTNDNSTKLLIEDVKLEDIISVEFLLPDNQLRFVKTNSMWLVNDYVASSRSVEIALSKLLLLEKSYIASEDVNNYNIYEVNRDKHKVTVNSHLKSYVIFIGKDSFNNGNFVRFDNSSTTISTNLSINSILDKDVSFFRDKTVTSFIPSLITSIKINNNSYIKDNQKWLKNSQPISSEVINPLLSLLTNIEGIAFAEESDYEELIKTLPMLEVLLISEGKEQNIYFIKYKENIYIKSETRKEYLITVNSLPEEITEIDSR